MRRAMCCPWHSEGGGTGTLRGEGPAQCDFPRFLYRACCFLLVAAQMHKAFQPLALTPAPLDTPTPPLRSYVLRDFALAEARLAGDTARVWASLVPNGAPAGH